MRHCAPKQRSFVSVHDGFYQEWPTREWLKSKFPMEAVVAKNQWGGLWVAYQMSFEYVLDEWAQGTFTRTRPSALQPFAGLFQTMMWSQQQGEAKQSELVGMTDVAEVDVALFSRSAEVKARQVAQNDEGTT